MAKIPFTVSARTAKLIGQENFATSEGAVVELVKNSYDADAKNCIIIFENHGDFSKTPCIYLIDNGTGMTSEIIKNQWMKIGTDDKLQNYLSESGRVKTGAKGIGRFALDRLGLGSEMQTISEDKETKIIEASIWSVQWSDFEKLGVAIHEVNANLDTVAELDIKSYLLEHFGGFEKIKEVLEETEFKFGTILKIHPPKDEWDEESMKSLFDNLEVLIPPQEQPEFSVHLFSTAHPEEFGKVNSAYYDDFDYKVKAEYLADESHSIKLTITREELDVNLLEKSYGEVFDNKLLKKFPYTLSDFKKKTFTISKTITELIGSKSSDENLISKIGEFDFTFYFLKNKIDPEDKKRFPYKNISSANRKAWLEKFGGVKIFRDDFRVRPYGESGQDWLGLGERQAKSPAGPGQRLGGYRIGSNQIAGTVNISRIANSSFQDKSGREGIQENDVFELFKNILIEVIAEFEKDRNKIMFCLAQLAKQKFKDDEDKRKAQEEADRILREAAEQAENNNNSNENSDENSDDNSNNGTDDNSSNSGPTVSEVILAKATKIFEQEIEDKDEEIRLLRGLASVGLIISSFAHELKGLRSRLSPRTDFLIAELKKYIKEEDLKSVNQQDNPFYMIQLIQEEDVKLKHWLDYSLSTLKRDKRTRTNINIGEYFELFEANWHQALVQRKVNVILKGNKNATNVIRAFEVDLDAIFNNLLSNSLSAFKDKKGNYQREVTIDWVDKGELIEITFSDNGCGLAPEYQSEPEKIFTYNESSKRDRKGNKIGTGMGLYIVSLVINDYNDAKVELIPVTDGFSIKVTVPKRKNQ
ncbi:ATP-binding protein [Fluviicola taffensis]|uniref:ATP-binding region ATPase domain protein n=1 Tax=Fluviicola taffensis (strain DSM 16823 / NCIMB 13979 / RW262) TaxID=755732 RepID=F2IJU6_FLUTR|nr:ATP-binding protein [Fluviicola taffensis]AEA45005.1 ATP-binding region ATPase domain protein [Fluviicola taffensis DSM 16823]